MEEMRNAYNVLVGKPEGKSTFGRPRRRCENNIRMNLKENGWKDVDWMNLAQDRDQWGGPCEHDNESSGFIKGGEFLD
jgi:hypothetical protein